jgi:hypothetical protein
LGWAVAVVISALMLGTILGVITSSLGVPEGLTNPIVLVAVLATWGWVDRHSEHR